MENDKIRQTERDREIEIVGEGEKERCRQGCLIDEIDWRTSIASDAQSASPVNSVLEKRSPGQIDGRALSLVPAVDRL